MMQKVGKFVLTFNVQNMETITPVIVYAESTPNPATLKYVVNRALLPDASVEYNSADKTQGSPLAAALFGFPFVKTVYITNNFVTVTKVEHVEWIEIMNELRDFVREFLNSGQDAVTFISEEQKAAKMPEQSKVASDGSFTLTEVEGKIVEILDEYIKPAVESDGGEISFRSFEDGVVTVVLRGSCSGCPSSTLTLKAGIEQLLKKMVPGVESVVAENE